MDVCQEDFCFFVEEAWKNSDFVKLAFGQFFFAFLFLIFMPLPYALTFYNNSLKLSEKGTYL